MAISSKVHRETWASRFGFIAATAGFSVGLGNIWRFPYMTGMNGGGAFLLVYLLFALFIGIPLMCAEIGLGRNARRTPLAGMRRLTGSWKSPWNAFSWLGVSAAVLIQSYYVMLIGWILGYFAALLRGRLHENDPGVLLRHFEELSSGSATVFGYTTIIVFLLGLIVSRGLRGGLERVAKLAMPLLLVLLVGLAARSMTWPGATAGLIWFLKPDFSVIDGGVVLAALGQAFYSIGIGMAAAFAFGSYLDPEKSDVPGAAALVVLCDTGVAVLAGLVMFPALFAFGIAPESGPNLLFLTMPALFATLPGGNLFGVIFFFLLLVAALTSAAALQEVLTTTLTDLIPMRRSAATWGVAAGILLLSTPIILSQGPWAEFKIFDLDLFGFVDLLTGSFMLPAGGLILALYTAFVWGFDRFQEDLNFGAGRFHVASWWKPLVVGLIPLCVGLVLLQGLGVFS